MPVVFTGRWTRGTILDQALQRVGNVRIKHLARDRLNRVLEELYTQWEWPFLYKLFPFTFPSGNTGGQFTIYPSFSLPSDFLKTESETSGLKVIKRDGLVTDLPVIEIDPIQFRRRSIPHDLTGNRPLIWYASYAEQIGYFWPAPSVTNEAHLVYKFLPSDIAIGTGSDATTTAYDADIPTFPWGGYLSMAMELWALQYDENPRAREFATDVAQALDQIRNIALPRASQEQTLPLDPQVFGPGFRDETSRYFRDWDWWGPSG